MSNISTVDALLSIMFLVISYLFGAIPFGLVIGKFRGIDIRYAGSNNIGSTNATRVLGKKWGFLVGLCDSFKGILVIFLLMMLKRFNVWTTPIDYSYYGLGAIIGHCYSIYIDFNGGKAVATTFGLAYLINPLLGVAVNLAWLLGLLITGYVSVGSLAFSVVLIIGSILLYFFGLPTYTNFFDYLIITVSVDRIIVFSIISILIVIKHIPNIKRLINKTEKGFKKHQKERLQKLAEEQNKD